VEAGLSTTELAVILNIINSQGSVVDDLTQVSAGSEILLLATQSFTNKENKHRAPTFSTCISQTK
jgi:hypothetical protein